MKNFYKQILDDVAIELTDEFDRNFERKAFFDRAWRQTKLINRRGTLMMRTSQLRRSIQMRKGDQSIYWRSSRIDASMHNEGGEITVTAKMKKYFWAMYYQIIGSQRHSVQRTASNRNRNQRLSDEANQWRSLALKPVGSKITIQQRQFIGDHPQVRRAIERCVDHTFQEIEEYVTNQLRQR